MKYVLITPARNEERYIKLVLESMIAQSTKPVRWVIVSDGSTDSTDSIVASYQRLYDWIRLVRAPQRDDRNFAAKVECFNLGLAAVRNVEYEVIGNLDADISFGPDYFEFLLDQFAGNARLGVVGTPFLEAGTHYDYRFTSIEHVSGACQLFRRECFEQIGGYAAIRGGGIDWVAVTTARMRGWKTRTFLERTCVHHRPMGTGSAKQLRALVRHGRKDYYLGGHPVWQMIRSVYQMTRPPYIVGGCCLLFGYVIASVSRQARQVSDELMAFHRSEQLARINRLLLLKK